MDWLGWKTTLGLLRDYPELIAATAQFAVGLGALVWGFRSLIGRERVATLKDLNANLEKRLTRDQGALDALIAHASDRENHRGPH
jgi:hypothetical protein